MDHDDSAYRRCRGTRKEISARGACWDVGGLCILDEQITTTGCSIGMSGGRWVMKDNVFPAAMTMSCRRQKKISVYIRQSSGTQGCSGMDPCISLEISVGILAANFQHVPNRASHDNNAPLRLGEVDMEMGVHLRTPFQPNCTWPRWLASVSFSGQLAVVRRATAQCRERCNRSIATRRR